MPNADGTCRPKRRAEWGNLQVNTGRTKGGTIIRLDHRQNRHCLTPGFGLNGARARTYSKMARCNNGSFRFTADPETKVRYVDQLTFKF